MANLFAGILSVVISVVLITGVVIPTVKGANTTGWTTTETTTYSIVTLVSILGLVYGVANIFGLV
jgi:hypothetical protein